MVLDETTNSLFPADLFIQPGDQPAIITEDLTESMIGLYRGAGIFAHEAPVRIVVDRIAQLNPAWIHPMHGGSLRRDLAARFYHSLRHQSFAFNGTLMGRSLAHPVA
jgi:flavorubredoxin